MFSERIAEALAGTQSIAIVGDTAKDMLYASAVSWGFQLISANASEIATFEQNQTASFSKSAGHWLVVLEGADLMENDHEDTLLDLLFDGSATLPANTLIAVHFSKYCDLSEALSDEDVPITYLEMDTPAEGIALVNAASILPEIFRRAPIDQTSIPLAA